mmetsp:Transcript_11451/g.70351  ORF Transcript_11451/g.70351 Transcript_11451/m.70351 type:complete len:341 (+) Transcript_11451:98-1120(+)
METRSMSVKELREKLDDAGVDYSDCFEKEDLVRRMEQTTPSNDGYMRRKTSQNGRDHADRENTDEKDVSSNAAPQPSQDAEDKKKAAGEKVKEDVVLIQKIKTTKDYYEILGLGKTASEIEIKKAYRKLALKLHPDKCNVEGAEEAFKKVSRAFDTLSSPDKRKTYDQFGVDDVSQAGTSQAASAEDIFNAFFGGQQFGGPGMGGPRVYRSNFGGAHVHQANLDDILSQLFGGGFASRPGRRPSARTNNPYGMGGSSRGAGQYGYRQTRAGQGQQGEVFNPSSILNMVFPLLVLSTVLFPGGHFLGMLLSNIPMFLLLYFLPPNVRKHAFVLMIIYFFFF